MAIITDAEILMNLSLAEEQKRRVVLATKTIEGLKQTVDWTRQKGRIK